jgi:flavin-dependent dehydrogenase
LGGELRTGTEAHTWRQDERGVVVDDVEATWLVAADGLHSRVRKEAGFTVRVGARRRMGMRRHFTVRPWSPYVEVHWSDGLEAYVTPAGPDRVGVALLTREKGDYDRFLGHFPDLVARLGPAETEVRGAGPFDVSVDGQVRGRLLLVGDAAGYVDALTGEGVALGLTSAAALVHTLVRERPEEWTATWRSITRRHRRLTGVLLAVADRPWLRRAMVRAFRRSPSLFASLLALNGEPPPAEMEEWKPGVRLA